MSKISKKGLTTIPSKVKELLGTEEGDYLEWRIVGDKVVVGIVKNPYKFLKGRHDDPNLTYDTVENEADDILRREVANSFHKLYKSQQTLPYFKNLKDMARAAPE